LKSVIFKILFNLRINKILHFYAKFKNYGIILCFHRVSNNNDILFPPLKIPVFEKLIKYISENFNVCNTSEFFNNEKQNKKLKILITFDDGYKDFVTNALPILKEYNIPAVHNIIINAVEKNEIPWTQKINDIINLMYNNKAYGNYKIKNYSFKISKNLGETVSSGMKLYKSLLNEKYKNREKFIEELQILSGFSYSVNQMMNWNDIQTCLKNNIEIGSHSYSHDLLSTIKDFEDLKKEIKVSKKIIESNIKTKVNVIAFPNGDYNNIVIDISKKSNYKYLLSTVEKFINFKIQYSTFPRISIYHNDIYESIFKIYNFHKYLKP
tara:strand:- start:2205 stop:3176 length:972 start_codon:yes stop_codon:yes gene_type:complete